MKRIGGLALMAACLGVLTSCSLGPGDRTHGENSGVSRDFSDIKSGGDSAVSGVADVTATGVGEIEPGGRKSSQSYGVLPPLGEFDRTSADFDLFDPCTEISLEVLKDAGFGERMPSQVRDSGVSHCGFDYLDDLGEKSFVGLGVMDRTLEEIENSHKRSRVYVGGRLPAVAFEDPQFGDLFCTLYLETVGGTITLNTSGDAQKGSAEDRCEFGEKILIRLFE